MIPCEHSCYPSGFQSSSVFEVSSWSTTSIDLATSQDIPSPHISRTSSCHCYR